MTIDCNGFMYCVGDLIKLGDERRRVIEVAENFIRVSEPEPAFHLRGVPVYEDPSLPEGACYILCAESEG